MRGEGRGNGSEMRQQQSQQVNDCLQQTENLGMPESLNRTNIERQISLDFHPVVNLG